MLIDLSDLAKERKLSKIVINRRLPNTVFIIIPQVNFPYKTFIDERLIFFYTSTGYYSDSKYCHSFVIAAGDSRKYQSLV